MINRFKQLALAEPDISVLWLYGSRARASERADSDYDLAIAFKAFDLSASEKSLRPHILLSDWQAALDLPEGVLSIVDINRCPIYLAINIINEAKVIVGKDTSRLMKEEARIRSMFEYLQVEQRRFA